MKKNIVLTALLFLSFIQMSAQEYEIMPILNEGKKWVNEKIIIDHGDTTSYYYVLETRGTIISDFLGTDMMRCHYYPMQQTGQSNDSIICLLKEEYRLNCYQNHALDYVENNGRNMINRIGYVGMSGLELLYPLNSWNHYFQKDYLIEIYLQYQAEPFLTEDNFFLYDSLEMDGYNCNRYAYIGEDGEPLAYIVEGIGFDSREMGDLLTPFTRKPGPDADYQEYWGLSHVVKDGKIIYKGMRYRDGAFDAIDEVEADKTRTLDANYYNMMGVPVGKELPTTPGIYIHQGKKICVSY